MRLIDADKLTKPTWAEDGASPDKRDGYNLGLYKMWQEIQNAPTVEQKQIDGYWIWNDADFGYECSACRYFWDYESSYSVFDHGAASYCPNCGAKMEGHWYE